MADVYVCRQCFEEYAPNPNVATGTDDGFCSDPCEQQYDAELGLREPLVPRGNFTLAEVKAAMQQAWDSITNPRTFPQHETSNMSLLQDYYDEVVALLSMQRNTETSNNV